MLKRDGWELDRVKGDHHTFKRADRKELITLTHPRKDLPIGQVRSIYRIAGWKI
jgi:predicted RNA binding protein YcfA (HicA-like mRNA interferase family)